MPGLKNKIYYGWVVVISFLVMGIVIWGIRLTYGIFLKSIAADYGLSRTTTSAIFSVYMILGSMFSIVGGWAIDRFGPKRVMLLMGIFCGLSLVSTSQTQSMWQLFLTFSLLLAIGTSATYAATMSTISRWFDRRRGLAMGIASTGGGFGVVIFSPVSTWLIADYGWRMTYLILGLVAWVILIPFSRLLRRDPGEHGLVDSDADITRQPDEKISVDTGGSTAVPGLTAAQSLTSRSFLAISVVVLFWSLCYFLVNTHLVPHLTDIGFSAGHAATALSLIGIMSIVGRILLGIASDRIGAKMAFIISLIIQFGAMFLLMWARDLGLFYLFASIYGFGYGASSMMVAALLSETFSLRNLGLILGVTDIGFGLGAAIGPTIGGLFYDINASYFMAFVIGALGLVIGIMALLLVRKEEGRTAV